MENDGYKWIGDGVKQFAVTAEYDRSDKGQFYKDDCPGESYSVRPGAQAAAYHVIGQGDRKFTSPQEVILFLTTISSGEFALDLQMNAHESAKFIQAWKTCAM